MYCFPQEKNPNAGESAESLKMFFKINNFKFRLNKSFLHRQTSIENKDVLFVCI